MNEFEPLAIAVVAVFGVIAALVVALCVRRIIRWRRGTTRRTRHAFITKVGKAVVAVVCIIALVTVQSIVSGLVNVLDLCFSITTGDETTETTEEDWYSLAYQIGEEGMVLLENEGDALPLEEGSKINLLGYRSYDPIYSGSGSSNVASSDAVSIVQSLEDAGFEINPALEDEGVYTSAEAEGSSVGYSDSTFSIDEVDISSFTGDASFESMAEYSDIAVITIGRSGGEGNDLTSYEAEEGEVEDYLQLSYAEQDLLEAACETFDTVIVLINSANALNMDVLSTYDIDALLLVGVPGPYGFEAVGKILTGEVNPSGHLTDTWVYDNDSAPANENFGEQEASNAEDRYYVDYVEGIYVGYKWYETAYAEEAVITNTTTGETFDYTDYDSVVAYPFGYGLSYTTFSQEIVGGLSDGDAIDATGSFTIEVEVTNTGDVAGKDVVQLYLTAPYTDYDVENGVEKAAAQLIAYGKTDELEPGESQTVTLEVSVEDLASYDSSHDNGDGTSGCYMLDAGEYVFSVRTDSHTVVDEVSAELSEQYFFSGENQRSSDEDEVSNEFEDAARGIYLSRYDGFANYEEAMDSVEDEIEDLTYATVDDCYDEDYYDSVVTEELVEGVDYDADGDLTLADVAGLDYDDPAWGSLISQLSLDELQSLTIMLYSDPEIDSIGLSYTIHTDGPLGITSMYSSELSGVAYPSIPLLAQTFNTELAYEMGSQVADQASTLGITAWYAPAMDTHRSAYSGRNYEYYSEDSYLAGTMAASEVSGATDKGLICYIKHFALNDQETNRDSLHTYSNEQAIREIYLRPFEMAVKDGGASGVMTSMNYIGDVYASAHEGLLTEVLRGEWGFEGSVITDLDGAEARSYWACLRAGTDRYLYSIDWMSYGEIDSDADIYYLQRAAHNMLYTLANSNIYPAEIVNWQAYFNGLYVELAVIAAAMVVSLVFQIMTDHKLKKAGVARGGTLLEIQGSGGQGADGGGSADQGSGSDGADGAGSGGREPAGDGSGGQDSDGDGSGGDGPGGDGPAGRGPA